jgi:integrase/recombinase XerD
MKAERISCRVVTDPRRIKNDDTIPLKLRITFKGKRKYYATQFSLSTNDWELLNSVSVKGKLRTIKNEVAKIEMEADKIANQITPFTFTQFETTFFQKSTVNRLLKDLFIEKIKTLFNNEQIGTATSYTAALTSLLKFKSHLLIEDISISFLQDYEKAMLQDSKAKATIGIYLRCLRTVLNIAIEEKLLSIENYPFGSRKYKIPTSQNIKKALDLASIKKIFEYEVWEDTNMGMARDFWIFSYLCNGINIMDVANLKWKDLTTDTIIFERQKTKNSNRSSNSKIVALRNEKINTIIKRWSNKNTETDNFVFDIINAGDSPKIVKQKVQQFIKVINKWMKKIGEDLEFELTLTTYVARHSFATILVQNGAPLEFASQSLGHTNLTTTQRYFAGFDLKAQKEFTKFLTDF